MTVAGVVLALDTKDRILKRFSDVLETQDIRQIPLLIEQINEMAVERPYTGLKLLQNIPLSVEAVCKLAPLIAGGAEVTVTCTYAIRPASRPDALGFLEQLGIPYSLNHRFDETFDFYLDCNAELLELPPPRLGAVELTGTGTQLFRQADWPVPMMSIDDSRCKVLETFLGTGEAVVRAFEESTRASMADQSPVIFGYGRVGKGIAFGLLKAGTLPKIVDVCPKAVALANERGLEACTFQDRASVGDFLREATCVITATGQQDVMSRYGWADALRGKYLINMGAEDEFGPMIAPHQVLYEKMPANFGLAVPTVPRYLDPSLYLHNLAPKLIMDRGLDAGYHPLPQDVDEAVLARWEAFHGENFAEVLQYA